MINIKYRFLLLSQSVGHYLLESDILLCLLPPQTFVL